MRVKQSGPVRASLASCQKDWSRRTDCHQLQAQRERERGRLPQALQLSQRDRQKREELPPQSSLELGRRLGKMC